MFDSSMCVDACSVCCISDKQKKAGRPWHPDCGGRKQLGDITDNVNFALADTSMQSDFEPPTTSNPT